MTKAESIGLFMNLNKLGHLQGVRFSYGVAKNINILKPEVEAIQKTVEKGEKFTEYDTKRVELCKTYAKKDEKGEAIMINNEFQIEDQKKFDKEITKLREDYKESIDGYELQIKQYNDLLAEPSTVELYKIKLADLPEAITTEEVNKIFNIIEE